MENPISKMTNRERLGVAAFVGLIALIVLGGWTYNRTSAPPLVPTQRVARAGVTGESGGVSLPAEKPTPTPNPTPAPPKELVVYVTGAVKKPGVYRFKTGERLYQAVERAGGFKADAVQEALNLADTLKDADQIHVPTKAAPKLTDTCSSIERDEPIKPTRKASTSVALGRVVGKPTVSLPKSSISAAPAAEAKPAKLASAADGSVNLNKADAETLQKLPGIGPAMAERILAYRKESGGFESTEDLQEVRGIGEKTFAKLKNLITI
jgi:competence protein ComEA